MSIQKRIKPSGTVLIAAIALVIGLEAPAAAHQIAHKISGSQLKPNTVTGKQIKESTLGTVPRATRARTLPALVWHPITTFENDWDNFQNGTYLAAYAVDAQGIVRLRGAIIGGTQEAAFKLPKKLAGAAFLEVPVQRAHGVGEFFLNPDGTVDISTNPGDDNATNTLADLDGVSFPAP
jgi:hypothetical protein